MKIKSTVFQGMKKIKNLPFDKALELSAIEILGLISDNADKGRGYMGSFKSYGSKYKAWRKDEGYSTKPNLQITGDMMRGILNSELSGEPSLRSDEEAKKTNSGWELTLTPPERQHSEYDVNIDEMVEYHNALRPFFGINSQYEKRANKRALDFLSKEYAKLQLD